MSRENRYKGPLISPLPARHPLRQPPKFPPKLIYFSLNYVFTFLETTKMRFFAVVLLGLVSFAMAQAAPVAEPDASAEPEPGCVQCAQW